MMEQDESTTESLMQDKYDLIIDKFEEEFVRNPEKNINEVINKIFMEFNAQIDTNFIFHLLMRILKSWVDMEEDYYPVIACWILGTYFFQSWISYPYIFINAQKRSGKTRLLKIISFLSQNGKYTMSLTESTLFRLPSSQKCGLFIDEVESIGGKEKGALRELLNVAYKRGGFVYRMRKNPFTEKYTPEEFELFIPLAMANIRGLEDVLNDRCLNIILERSNKNPIINRIEWFEKDPDIALFKGIIILPNIMTVVTDDVAILIYSLYNIISSSSLTSLSSFVNEKYSDGSKNDLVTVTKKFEYNGVIGRDLELWLPLFIIKLIFTANVDDLITIASKFVKDRQITDAMEDLDTAMLLFLFEFMKGKNAQDFISYKELTDAYKEKTNFDMKPRLLSSILKRLKIVVSKKRTSKTREIIIDYPKIKEKIRKIGIKIDEEESKSEGNQEISDFEEEKSKNNEDIEDEM